MPLGKTAQKQGDRVQMGSLNEMALRKLAELEAGNLRRRLKETDRNAGAYVEREGRTLVSFCCNDYLNLAHDPRVTDAAKMALDKWGASAGASRLVTGNHSIFAELESRLSGLKQTDDCLVFGSGYLANLGIIPTLMKPGDLILADEPLGNQDKQTGREVLGILLDMAREGERTVVMVTHDPENAESMDRTVELGALRRAS